MNHWAPIFGKIVESSIWDEDDSVCKIWITLLALKDADHVVRKTPYAIGLHARKNAEEVMRALKVLSSPDARRPGQENDGRRICAVEDGWLILNGEKYRDLMRKINRQAYQAQWAREHRAKLAAENSEKNGKEKSLKDINDQVDTGRIPDDVNF